MKVLWALEVSDYFHPEWVVVCVELTREKIRKAKKARKALEIDAPRWAVYYRITKYIPAK